MSTPEKAWQILNVVDAAQTMHVANSPECYREVDPVTSRLVGESPSQGEVAAVMTAYALGHYYVTKWMERKAEDSDKWADALKAWHFVGITWKSAVIVKNHNNGIRPFGSGC